MNNGSSTTHNPFKIVVFILIAIVLLIAILIAALPAILSSDWGKRKLIAFAKERYGVEIKVNRLELHWFRHLEMTDLSCYQEKNALQFSCDIVKTEATLWDVLVRRNFGHLYFDRPHLKLTPSMISLLKPTDIVLPLDTLQLASLSSIPGLNSPLPKISMPLSGFLNCTFGTIELQPFGMQPIVFDEISLDAEISPQKKLLYVNVSAQTQQRDLKGKLEATASIHKTDTDYPSLDAKANITQLPIAGIDQLLALSRPQWSGMLVNLIGTTADLKLNLLSSSGNFDIDLLAASPLFNAQMTTVSANNQVSLKSPATFSLKLTPDSFKKLAEIEPRLQSLSLSKESTLKGIINHFNSPVPHQLRDFAQSSFDASLSNDSPFAFQFNNQPLTLDRFVMNVKNSEISGNFKLDGNLALVTQGPPATFTWDALINPATHTRIFSLNALALPVDLMGSLAGVNAPLSSWIGPTLNLKSNGTVSPETNKVTISAESSLLKIERVDFIVDDQLTLTEPSAFTYFVSPAAFSQLLPTEKLTLVQPAQVKGMINTLVLPLSHLSDTQCEASIASEHFDLKGKEPLVISNIEAHLAVGIRDRIFIQLSSDLFKSELTAKYQKKTGEVVLTNPFRMELTVGNALMQNFSPVAINLTEPTQLDLTIEPFSFFPKTFSLTTLTLKGILSSPHISMAPYQGSPQLALYHINMPFLWNGKAKSAEFQLRSLIQPAAGEQGSIAMKTTFSNIELNKLGNIALNSTIDLQKLPSSLVDSFIGKPFSQTFAGQELSSTITLLSTPSKQTLSLSLISPLLTIKGSLATDDKNSLLKGTVDAFNWTLTPQSYLLLDNMVTKQNSNSLAFELKEPTTFKTSWSQLSLPISPSTGRIPTIQWDLAVLEGKGQGENPLIGFLDNSSQEVIQLSDVNFTFSKVKGDSPLSITLDSQVSSGTSKAGSLALKTSIERLFDEKNQLNLQTLSSDITLNIKQFPSRALDLFARMKGRTDAPFSKVFGDVINASLLADLKNFTGPVSLNINSPNVRFAMDSSIKDGALRLEKNLYAQMMVTQEMSQVFLKDVNPLSITYFYSQAPVTCEIPASGFYLPLRPFDVGKITLPQTTIELGKIACRNEGNVNIALGLLRSKQFEVNRELQLWFAPMQFNISEGTLNLDRTEILLADTYDIAIWGKILLVDDYVDMLLGLTASTLSQAFGIKNLPNDYVLTIPMKGRSDKVKIDSSKATAKIALLLASQQKAITDSFGKKSGAGAILGGVMQQMATLPDSKAKVPPAKHPYPWENGTSTKKKKISDTLEESNKRHFKQDEKPLKQIMKVIR